MLDYRETCSPDVLPSGSGLASRFLGSGWGDPPDKVERVRTDMALLGAATGTGIAVFFGLLPSGTPLSDSLLIAIPVAAMASVTGVLAIPGILGPFRLPQTIGMGFISGAFWIRLVGIP